MATGWKCFNLYLVFAGALAACCGCHTKEGGRKSEYYSTLRLHLEADRDPAMRNEVVAVCREHPISVNVQSAPLLTEGSVQGAKVVEVLGGFALSIQFDHQGTLLLEQYTTLNRGRKLVVFAQFGEKMKENRWLAAPVISRRITDGVLLFTPDATREEAEQIALGLNHVAKKVQSKWSSE
jgi:preprotein translocase subunit SecD